MKNLFSKEKFKISCILLLLLIVAFFDVFFLGKTFKATTANSQALPEGVYGQLDNKPKFIPVNGSDAPVLEEPIYEFIKQNLKKGILPLWNPHQACGYPLVGMIQVGIFFPLNAIMYLFPPLYAWDLLILSRFFLAGLFTYWFMRTMGFKKIPSFTSGIVFMLSGPMVLLQYWTVNVDILAPVLLIAYERLIKSATIDSAKKFAGNTSPPFNIVFLAITIALTIFAGHPEHIFLVNAYAFAFFLFRIFCYKKIIDYKKISLYCVSSYTLGVGLSAITLFPFLYHLASEFWHGHPDKVGLLMEEHRHKAITLALPHFFQEVPLTYKWVFAGWWGGYLGTLPLGLAFLSLFNKHKKGLSYFFATLVVIIIGKEYGLWFINWIGHLPLFSMCRYAIHSTHLAALSVAILAGMGVRTIITSSKKIFLKGLIYSSVLLLIIGIHLVVLRNSKDFHLAIKASLFALGILIIFQAILFIKDKKIINKKTIGIALIIITFTELFLYIHRERPYRFDSFAKVPYIEFIKSQPERARSYGIFWAFYPNTATGFEVDDLGYFFGLVPKRFVPFVNSLVIKNHFRNDLRPPALRAIPVQGQNHILNLLNVRYIVAPSEERLSTLLTHFEKIKKNLNPVYAKEVTIYERKGAFPRAFIVHRVVSQLDQDKTLEIVDKLKDKLRIIAVINSELNPKILAYLKSRPLVDKSTAEIIKYTPNEIVVKANFENAGFLVLSEAFHPDWKGYIDGQETKVFQTNYLLRSVLVPEGQHNIRFIFKPFSFYFGTVISILSFIMIMILSCLGRRKEPDFR